MAKETQELSGKSEAAGINGMKALVVESSERYKKNKALRDQAAKVRSGARAEKGEAVLGTEPASTEAEASSSGQRPKR